MSDMKRTRDTGGADLKALADSVTGVVNEDVRGRIRIVVDGEVDIDVVDKHGGKTYINVVPVVETGAAGTLTVAELAALLGATPERLRGVLRDLGLGVGSGNRYDLAGLPSQTLLAIRARVQ